MPGVGQFNTYAFFFTYQSLALRISEIIGLSVFLYSGISGIGVVPCARMKDSVVLK